MVADAVFEVVVELDADVVVAGWATASPCELEHAA
jgi:L-amino acid N-acyltransferase YncA